MPLHVDPKHGSNLVVEKPIIAVFEKVWVDVTEVHALSHGLYYTKWALSRTRKAKI